jgi:hypothetical protein
MKYFLFVGILVYMFFTTSVAAKIGVQQQVGTFSTAILFILFLLLFIKYDFNKLSAKFKIEFQIIISGIVVIFIKIYLGRAKEINDAVFVFIVPMVISILLGMQSIRNIKIIKKLIIFFFICECFLSIYERVTFSNTFQVIDVLETKIEFFEFRSTAFLGHPLANALIVSIIMGFILISKIKISFKFFYCIIGFVSILCFNARAAILVWTLIFTVYILKLFMNKRTKLNIKLSLFTIVPLAIYYLIILVENGFGGRIINEKINDESSQTRIDVYKSFFFIDTSDLWFGNASNYFNLMNKLNAGGVENGYIVLIINYGIPFFIIITIFYFRLINKFLKHNNLFDNVIILMSFLILGSTNNALAGATPWSFFILCVYAFSNSKPREILL